jgi:hypothetical protein
MKILVYAVVLMLITTELSAQGFLNRIKEKAIESATRKTEERIERKIDEKIDESLDSTESSLKSNQSGENQQDPSASILGKMFGGGGDVKLLDNYEFDANFVIETSLLEKDKITNLSTMKMHVPKDGQYFGMELVDEKKKDNPVMIFDFGQMAMITLTKTDEKSGFAMVIKLDEELIADSDPTKDEKVIITKQPGTKTILGYTCENYIIEHDGSITDAWITKDIKFNPAKALKALASQQKKSNPYKGIPDGFALESVTTIKGEKTQSVYKVKQINLNSKSNISTEGYQMMNLGNFGR